MAKKRKNWQQSHITDLKRHNTMLQDCCKDYAKDAQALRRSIEVLKADLSDAKHVRDVLAQESLKLRHSWSILANAMPEFHLKQLNINEL